MEHQQIDELTETRRSIQPLLSASEPADGLTSYYALWHDPHRTHLASHRNLQGRVDGFVAVSQTGSDLFRPLITLRAADDAVVGQLLHSALAPNRFYRVIVPIGLAAAVRAHMDISRSSLTYTYRLDPTRFRPIINVLVQQVEGADGSPRFQIESQGQLAAMSGTNWRSPFFAEVFVYSIPMGRRRGWGRSVVSACTARLLEDRLRPLYIVEEGNQASLRIAEGLGYVTTGHCEFVGEGKLK
jgi:hypothetical protein